MRLRTSAGTYVQVKAVAAWTQTSRVHNLTVAEDHTYHVAVGEQSVLVRNCGGKIPYGTGLGAEAVKARLANNWRGQRNVAVVRWESGGQVHTRAAISFNGMHVEKRAWAAAEKAGA